MEQGRIVWSIRGDVVPAIAAASAARFTRSRHCQLRPRVLDYFPSRIEGVKVTPTSKPSGEMKRLTIWPQGSFLFLTSIS